MSLLQEDGLEGKVEGSPLGGRESQGERVRRSLVTLDNALPAIALPDGVHCRSFTGARGAPKPAHTCAKQACRWSLSPVKASAPHGKGPLKHRLPAMTALRWPARARLAGQI